MSGVTCPHFPWTSHAVGLHRPWHDRMLLVQHTRSNDVEHGMPLVHLDITHSRTTSGFVGHTRPWITHTDERRRA